MTNDELDAHVEAARFRWCAAQAAERENATQPSPIQIAQHAIDIAKVCEASRQHLLKAMAQHEAVIQVQGQIIGHLRREVARMAKRP